MTVHKKIDHLTSLISRQIFYRFHQQIERTLVCFFNPLISHRPNFLSMNQSRLKHLLCFWLISYFCFFKFCLSLSYVFSIKFMLVSQTSQDTIHRHHHEKKYRKKVDMNSLIQKLKTFHQCTLQVCLAHTFPLCSY